MHAIASPVAACALSEQDLLRAYADGDLRARDEVILRFMPRRQAPGGPLSAYGRVAGGPGAGRLLRPDQGRRPLRPGARSVHPVRDPEHPGRAQAPFPRQGLGHPRDSLRSGADAQGQRGHGAPVGPARPFAVGIRHRQAPRTLGGGGLGGARLGQRILADGARRPTGGRRGRCAGPGRHDRLRGRPLRAGRARRGGGTRISRAARPRAARSSGCGCSRTSRNRRSRSASACPRCTFRACSDARSTSSHRPSKTGRSAPPIRLRPRAPKLPSPCPWR